MKKISTILILSLFSFSAFAQIPKLPQLTSYGFRLGLTASPTIGWVKPEQGKSDGIALGFSYGLMGDFNFAPNYSFSTALTITTMNGKSTEVDPTYIKSLDLAANKSIPVAYDLKYKVQYLELPLTIKLKTVKDNGRRYYGQFGLSNSFLLSAKQDAVSSTAQLDNVKISDYTKFYRAGLIIGGGGEFDISENTSFVAGLTFNNGFTNITTDKNRDVRNHYLGLNFGVFF